jgi:AcrR family transcriptional regulator
MKPKPRAPLTRERVLRSGLELADASGVEALTMRRLGDELGFEAMSLYRHVANKGDLLDGMLDLVLEEWQTPAGGGGWADAVRTSARSVHDALRRHPWAARLLMTGAHIRPRRLAYMEWLLGTLRDAGFGPDTTYHVYHLLDGYIFGFSLWEIAYAATGERPADRAAFVQRVPWDELPHLSEHRDQHMTDGPHREVDAFEVGLDLMLDGLRGATGT